MAVAQVSTPVVNDMVLVSGGEHVSYPRISVSPIRSLQLISGGAVVRIPATNGSEKLVVVHGTYGRGIDEDFTRRCEIGEGKATKEMQAKVFEVIVGGDMPKIFGPLTHTLWQRCFTSCQVQKFLEVPNNQWINPEGFTLIPFRHSGVIVNAIVHPRKIGGYTVFLGLFSEHATIRVECGPFKSSYEVVLLGP